MEGAGYWVRVSVSFPFVVSILIVAAVFYVAMVTVDKVLGP